MGLVEIQYGKLTHKYATRWSTFTLLGITLLKGSGQMILDVIKFRSSFTSVSDLTLLAQPLHKDRSLCLIGKKNTDNSCITEFGSLFTSTSYLVRYNPIKAATALTTRCVILRRHNSYRYIDTHSHYTLTQCNDSDVKKNYISTDTT